MRRKLSKATIRRPNPTSKLPLPTASSTDVRVFSLIRPRVRHIGTAAVRIGVHFRNQRRQLGDVRRIVVNERPLAVSLVGGGCQGPRSIWFGQNERPKLCAREGYRPVKKLTLAPEDFRQLGDVHSNPSRLILAEQLGCHALLIFEVWLICTIQGPKDFRASMYAKHGPEAVLRPAADGDGARILVLVEREKGWSDDPDAAPLP
jgi:hypothetical protein